MIETIRFKLNGRPVRLKIDGEQTLLWVLRTDLGVTGPKYGCGEGFCGACTVLVNDAAVLACQRDSPKTASCIRFKKRSSAMPVSNAATVHPA